jgi:uncharacterized membrane protein YfcA
LAPWEVAAILVAGAAAGAINAVVGSGSLITFPTLLALGYPPIVANVSNNVGLVAGGVSGVIGYRAELRGQRELLTRLGVASVAGAVAGGLLLMSLPAKAFQVIVVALIALACVMVVLQPRLNAWLSHRRGTARPHGGIWLWLGILGAGMYGGYFGAAQGVVLIGLLGIFLTDHLQRINAAKNMLSLLVNASAAVLFALIAPVDWWVVLLLSLGSTLGGFLGARLGRRLSPRLLRGVIVIVGLVAIVKLVYG